MASSTGKETIAIHIITNMSRSKKTRYLKNTTKSSQLTEYNQRNFFFKILPENETGRLGFFVFKKR